MNSLGQETNKTDQAQIKNPANVKETHPEPSTNQKPRQTNHKLATSYLEAFETIGIETIQIIVSSTPAELKCVTANR